MRTARSISSSGYFLCAGMSDLLKLQRSILNSERFTPRPATWNWSESESIPRPTDSGSRLPQSVTARQLNFLGVRFGTRTGCLAFECSVRFISESGGSEFNVAVRLLSRELMWPSSSPGTPTISWTTRHPTPGRCIPAEVRHVRVDDPHPHVAVCLRRVSRGRGVACSLTEETDMVW
jgi:hypothetical protein